MAVFATVVTVVAGGAARANYWRNYGSGIMTVVATTELGEMVFVTKCNIPIAEFPHRIKTNPTASPLRLHVSSSAIAIKAAGSLSYVVCSQSWNAGAGD